MHLQIFSHKLFIHIFHIDLFNLLGLSTLFGLQVRNHSFHRANDLLGTGIVELVFFGLRIANNIIVYRTIRVDEVNTREVSSVYKILNLTRSPTHLICFILRFFTHRGTDHNKLFGHFNKGNIISTISSDSFTCRAPFTVD